MPLKVFLKKSNSGLFWIESHSLVSITIEYDNLSNKNYTQMMANIIMAKYGKIDIKNAMDTKKNEFNSKTS